MFAPVFLQMSLRGNILERAANSIKNAPNKAKNDQVKIAQSVKYYVRKYIAVEPKKAKKILRWASPKQQAYVNWAQAKGIIRDPYVRTHALKDGWIVTVKVQRFDGTIAVVNKVPYSGWVQGERQQPFHEDTGWVKAPTVLKGLEDEWAGRSAAAWFTGDLR